jgi:hypothetical protein
LPSAYDQEFTSALSGWTTLGSLDVAVANDIPSHVRLRKTLTAYLSVDGIYRPAPTPPFTMTAKLTDYLHDGNYHNVGLMLAPSSPGPLFTFGPMFHSSNSFWTTFFSTFWANRTTRSSYNYPDGPYRKPYIRLVVASSTDVSCEISENGLVWWRKAANLNPGFTIANFGLFLTRHDGTMAPAEVVVDWIRFT